VGTHNITAVYAGDVNFAPSTSLALTQVVSQAGTTTTVSASPSPSILGQTVMLTANVGGVAPGAGTPTGTVTFLDGATVLGTGSLSSAGISTLSTSSLSSGNHNLTASYGGDPNFTASTSASVTFTVQSSSPATHLVASEPASATAGIAFGVTVTALDTSNNQATSYIDTVTLSSTDAQAGLPAPYTFTASDHGTHVFAVTLNTAGTQTISATDTPNAAITGTSAPISVTSAVPPPVQITDNETIKISDAESFTDPFDAEAVHVADAVFVTPLIAVTAPVAEFSPGGLRFGGQNGTQTITVSNIGGASLTLTSAAVSASIQFSIAQISCSNGTTSLSTVLPSGGACILTINYTASTTPANDTAMLVFNDNAALSNLPTTPSGATYTQSVPLNGGGTNIAPPPPPPATVSVMDNETIHVADAESFPDVFDSETITVSDQVTVKIVSNPTTTSISAAGVTYGTAATTTVSVSSLSGTVAGSVTLSVDGGAPSSISLSNGSAVFNLGVLSAGSHSLSANYVTQGSFSGSSAQTTLVVNQATPTISWANPAPIIFGTALSSTQLNATASVPGSFVYSPAPGTVLTGGIQTLSVAFTPTDTTDYTTATANVTLIVDARPVFTSPNATTFTVGTASSFTVTAMGVPAPALSYSSLPARVVFNSVTGVLSGAPAPGTGGTYSITFSALNSVGVANQAFTLTVNEAPTITSKSTVTFVVGVAGAFLPTATGFPSPVYVESGALPQGLSFALNVLSGTAVEGTEGTYNTTLTANNGVGSAATQKVTLVVIPQSLPAFTSPSSATFGFACSNSTCTNLINALHNSFTVTTTGNPTPKLTVSRLPAGLTFTDNGNGTATLSGSPSFSTHLTFTATGAGGTAFAATQSFTLIVNPLPPPPAFTSPSQAAFAAGQPNTFTVAAAPFIDRITMSSASANFLPPWMVLTDNHDGTATLSGIPDDQPGQMFKITFTASNSGDPNYKVTQAFSLVLLP
jgi:large repetitive protein